MPEMLAIWKAEAGGLLQPSLSNLTRHYFPKKKGLGFLSPPPQKKVQW